jgi:hypothetical protein
MYPSFYLNFKIITGMLTPAGIHCVPDCAYLGPTLLVEPARSRVPLRGASLGTCNTRFALSLSVIPEQSIAALEHICQWATDQNG